MEYKKIKIGDEEFRLYDAEKKRKNGIPPIGKKFGTLEVIGGPYQTFLSHALRWGCKCDCGNVIYPEAKTLIDGKSKCPICFSPQHRFKKKV